MDRLAGPDNKTLGAERMAGRDTKTMGILMTLSMRAPQVDPDNFSGALGPLLDLDRAGIYGKDIATLFQVCGENAAVMVGVLRAEGLGFTSTEKIKAAISTHGQPDAEKLDVQGLVTQVMDRLPNSFHSYRDGSKTLLEKPDQIIIHHVPIQQIDETHGGTDTGHGGK
jgi:hypothetical protein